jgi:hypothetical protein
MGITHLLMQRSRCRSSTFKQHQLQELPPRVREVLERKIIVESQFKHLLNEDNEGIWRFIVEKMHCGDSMPSDPEINSMKLIGNQFNSLFQSSCHFYRERVSLDDFTNFMEFLQHYVQDLATELLTEHDGITDHLNAIEPLLKSRDADFIRHFVNINLLMREVGMQYNDWPYVPRIRLCDDAFEVYARGGRLQGRNAHLRGILSYDDLEHLVEIYENEDHVYAIYQEVARNIGLDIYPMIILDMHSVPFFEAQWILPDVDGGLNLVGKEYNTSLDDNPWLWDVAMSLDSDKNIALHNVFSFKSNDPLPGKSFASCFDDPLSLKEQRLIDLVKELIENSFS